MHKNAVLCASGSQELPKTICPKDSRTYNSVIPQNELDIIKQHVRQYRQERLSSHFSNSSSE